MANFLPVLKEYPKFSSPLSHVFSVPQSFTNSLFKAFAASNKDLFKVLLSTNSLHEALSASVCLTPGPLTHVTGII